ncbi:MAG: hypothetical protein ACTIL0_03480 [Microbacterium gubbeenense]
MKPTRRITFRRRRQVTDGDHKIAQDSESRRSRRESASAGWTVVGALLVAAIVAGQLQNAFEALVSPGVRPIARSLDDVLVLAAVVAGVRRLRELPLLAVGTLALYVLTMTVAAGSGIVISGLPKADVLFLFRQSVMPALLMLAGMTLQRREWHKIGTWVLWIGVANALYCMYEIMFGRLIDPVEFESGDYVGFYLGTNPFTGEVIDRAGGFLLNPPTVGMFLCAALFVAVTRTTLVWYYRWPAVGMLLVAIWLVNSRGGILALGIAVGLPIAVRFVNAWGVIALGSLAMIPLGVEVASHAGSGRHSAGLLRGIEDAIFSPFGRGLGYAGLGRPSEITDAASESLLAIPFSAGGVLVLIIVLALFIRLVLLLNNGGHQSWIAGLALGVLSAALFAETAGAISGTVPLWLAAGLALSRRFDANGMWRVGVVGAIPLSAIRPPAFWPWRRAISNR